MLLKDILYQILGSENNESGVAYTVRISDTHPIFKGHFPETPVLPGVCILQIFKELSEDALSHGKSLQYSEIKQCKFQTPVLMKEPRTMRVDLTLTPEQESWKLSATLKDQESVFAIMKAVLSE